MRPSVFFAAWLAVQLVACGGKALAPEPHWRAEAFAAEQEGARRHARGDYEGAAKSFGEAERHFVAIDDSSGAQRARRHQSTALLSAGHAEQALALLDTASAGDIDVRRLRVQAFLALSQPHAASGELASAVALCVAPCSQKVALQLLGGRVALMQTRPAEAIVLAETALSTLKGTPEERSETAIESANAYRLLAEARLQTGEFALALKDAEQALTLDRKLALPEKIARDWLLIGDIHRKTGAGSNVASGPAAISAYQHARDIAAAAGLRTVVAAANTAISHLSKEQNK